MNVNFTQILEWLKEICEEEPNSFASHFYSDIENFLELDETDENCLKDVCGEKFIHNKKLFLRIISIF